MSKKVKNLITRELGDKFKGVDSVAVINPRGINATKNNQIRRKLREQGLRMTVVKNTLAKRAVDDGSKLKGFDKLLDGPSAVIYGQASVATIARLILNEKKADERSSCAASSSTAKFTSATRASSRSASCQPARKRSGRSSR
jgi:large subunit ribosomal protein L10